MNVLPEIIGNLSKEEIRNYKLFVTRTNDTDERKDIELFNFYRKTYPETKEDKAFSKLYQGNDKNPFYRLKNRLLEDIGLSLLLLNYNDNAVNFVLNNFLLAKLFIEKSKWDTATFYLQKAERKAKEIDEPALLELVYNEYIKLSQEVLEINPQEYIEKRRANRNKLNQIQEIDDILAMVTYNIKTTQTFGKGKEEIFDTLQKTVEAFGKSKNITENTQLRFKLYHAISRLLLQQHNYKDLEVYLIKTFKEFTQHKLFSVHNHDTKLQMLTYLCNSLFRNNKSELSLEYAARLKEAMLEHGKLLHDKYVFYYYNILVNNYAQSNVDKAIEILNEAREEPAIKNHPLHIGFVFLNLAVSYFGKDDYKQSLKQISRLYILDSYASLDVAFRLKISVFELMVRYDSGDTEFVLTRITQLRNEFKTALQQPEFNDEKQLCHFLKNLVMLTKETAIKKLHQQIAEFINEKKGSKDAEIINYADWLKGKIGIRI